MKKRILRITILVLLVGAIIYFNGGPEKILISPTVQAFGDLVVDFHVPIGNPIFSLFNMKPSDIETRPIDVTNNGSVPRFISTRGIRTGGSGSHPKLESALVVTIKDGVNPIYGPSTMADFFSQSGDADGIPLNTINPGGNKTYNFAVEFPAGANNQYQAKSVLADIKFGTIVGDDLVINEVFYNVDEKHGLREKKDKKEEAEERRLAAIDRRFGSISVKTRLKFQWIELYNGTDHEISLKGWRIYNESGKYFDVHPNKKLKAGQFALLSHDGSLWRFWNTVTAGALRLEIGAHFAGGLDIDGDVLILKNPKGVEVDRMSWGDNTSGFTPVAVNPKVEKGHSTDRQAPGFDTDSASDWVDRNPPTPGS